MTQEAKPLFVQYLNTEPIKVDPAGCEDVADLIKKAQKEFSPDLDAFPPSRLTLHRDNGTKLRPGIKIAELVEETDFKNSDLHPLLIKTLQLENERNEAGEIPKFIKFLKLGKIDHPNQDVLNVIVRRYWQQLNAALAVGAEPCIELYTTVRALPATFTRGVIQSEMNISINGPMSLTQPNILIAVDLDRGKHIFIKLLRIPETTTSQSTQAKNDAVSIEMNTCTMLSEKNIIGLVKCDAVKVTVQHSEGLNVAPGVWAALRMKRYMSSLAEIPQLTEKWLYRGFSRILTALKEMHKLNLVHMDVKADNLFVDEDLNWDLGDFGSTRENGALIWSFTEVLNPYTVPSNATVIPAMDFVLLCVVIAIELKKDEWKLLCGQHQKVQEHLVIEQLNSIKDDDFKREVVDLFNRNLKIVQRHLLNSTGL